jgi:hypothetical protein
LDEQAKSLAVSSSDDAEVAKVLIEQCDDHIKMIDEYFVPKKKKAQEVHKEWVKAHKDSLAPYQAAKAKLRAKLSDYQKRLDAAVEKAGEDALVAKPMAGRKFWKFKIVDESKIPSEYWTIDEKKIGSEVRSKKDNAKIPGVEVYYEY